MVEVLCYTDGSAKGRERWLFENRKKREVSERERERGQHEVSVQGLGGTRWETHAARREFQRAWVESDDDPVTPDGAMTIFLILSSSD